MASLVSNIMDLSKLSAGELVMTPEPFALAPVCEEAVGVFRALHPALVINVSVDGGAAGPVGDVLGSEMHVAQVLRNLLANACEATEKHFVTGRRAGARPARRGKGTVSLNVTRVAGETEDVDVEGKPTTTYRFVVRDNGPGMNTLARTRLRDQSSFYALYSQTGLKASTGLGLPIAQSLVTLMGGVLRAESRRGDAGRSGTKFTFCVAFGDVNPKPDDGTVAVKPVAVKPEAVKSRPPSSINMQDSIQAAMAAAAAARRAKVAAMSVAPRAQSRTMMQTTITSNGKPSAERLAALPTSRGRILLADDDEWVLFLLKDMLKKIVPLWEIAEAATAEDAIAMVKRGLKGEGSFFDVLFIDENFGLGKTGTEATKELRAFEASMANTTQKRTFVSGMTGFYDDQRYIDRATFVGQNGILEKPLNPEGVKAMLAHASPENC